MIQNYVITSIEFMDVKEIHLITTDIIKSLDCCFRGSKTTETKLLFSKKAIWQIILTINFVLHIKEDDTQSGNPILCGFFQFCTKFRVLKFFIWFSNQCQFTLNFGWVLLLLLYDFLPHQITLYTYSLWSFYSGVGTIEAR